MARRSTSRRGNGAAAASDRDRILDAFLKLLAERRYHDVALADIADEAGVSLAELRGAFSGKGAMVDAFVGRIDRAMLEGGPAEGDSSRERLFDVMMRRFDALDPHKPAVASLARSARVDPGLAAELACLGLRSTRWMFAAAGLNPRGLHGMVATRGAALVFAETFRVWLSDDDAGLAATMAALDKALRRGDRVMRALDDCAAVICRVAARRPGEAATG